ASLHTSPECHSWLPHVAWRKPEVVPWLPDCAHHRAVQKCLLQVKYHIGDWIHRRSISRSAVHDIIGSVAAYKLSCSTSQSHANGGSLLRWLYIREHQPQLQILAPNSKAVVLLFSGPNAGGIR
ncbi:MAG: hypothetical protein ACKPKO_39880, partial [Candidatus Fonsibacter sp.]